MKKLPITLNQQQEKLSTSMQDYINRCEVNGFSQDTIVSYSQTIQYFIDCIGDKEIHKVIQKDIDKYILFLRQKGNTDTTISTRIKALKPFFKYANIDCMFPSISRNTKKRVPYTKEELAILLRQPTKMTYTQQRNWAIANFMYGTACRCSSLIHVKIKNIDFTNNTVYFSVAKGRKPYYVPLSTELKKVLKKYLSMFNWREEDYLFQSLYGEQFKRDTLKMTMREYHLKRGIQKTSLHLYRHTFALDYLRNGGNIMYLKELMNHSDIKITQQYLNVTVDDIQSTFDNFSPLDNVKRKGIKLIS